MKCWDYKLTSLHLDLRLFCNYVLRCRIQNGGKVILKSNLEFRGLCSNYFWFTLMLCYVSSHHGQQSGYPGEKKHAKFWHTIALICNFLGWCLIESLAVCILEFFSKFCGSYLRVVSLQERVMMVRYNIHNCNDCVNIQMQFFNDISLIAGSFFCKQAPLTLKVVAV